MTHDCRIRNCDTPHDLECDCPNGHCDLCHDDQPEYSWWHWSVYPECYKCEAEMMEDASDMFKEHFDALVSLPTLRFTQWGEKGLVIEASDKQYRYQLRLEYVKDKLEVRASSRWPRKG